MQDKTFLLGIAIISLLILESWALYLGYNGALFFPVVVVIAGLAGYEVKNLNSKDIKLWLPEERQTMQKR